MKKTKSKNNTDEEGKKHVCRLDVFVVVTVVEWLVRIFSLYSVFTFLFSDLAETQCNSAYLLPLCTHNVHTRKRFAKFYELQSAIERLSLFFTLLFFCCSVSFSVSFELNSPIRQNETTCKSITRFHIFFPFHLYQTEWVEGKKNLCTFCVDSCVKLWLEYFEIDSEIKLTEWMKKI